MNDKNKPFVINSKNKKEFDADYIADEAIKYVKSSPCCICRFGLCCEIKYKGTCPIWRELTYRLLYL